MSLPAPLLALPATLILPPDLDQPILDELLELWNQFRPRDAFERLLVTRILQAVARLQISALRETDEADPLWLRYESAADRLFRQSIKALEAHRLIHPVIETTATQPAAPPAHAASPTPPQPIPQPSSIPVTPAPPTNPSPVPLVARSTSVPSTKPAGPAASPAPPHAPLSARTEARVA